MEKLTLDKRVTVGYFGKLELKSQEDWIRWHNEGHTIMASAPDIYQAAQYGSDNLMQSLYEDFKKGIVTSTRIIYKPNFYTANIIHYFGSKVVKPIKLPRIQIISSYGEQKLLQSIFNTKDPKEKIKRTLERLSEKPKDKINVWTVFGYEIKDCNEKAVVLCYFFEKVSRPESEVFDIRCDAEISKNEYISRIAKLK